jgi:hypothetical protein
VREIEKGIVYPSGARRNSCGEKTRKENPDTKTDRSETQGNQRWIKHPERRRGNEEKMTLEGGAVEP